jgi:hypothetical protein
VNVTKQQVDEALERKGYYWNNYTRKLIRYGSPSRRTRHARALYVQSLTRYYSLAQEYHRDQS